MAYSKVVVNGTTIMDVTQDTVTSSNMLSGIQATKADGTKATGIITSGTILNDTTLPTGISVNGTIPSGSYIKIGAGNYSADQYFQAQNMLLKNIVLRPNAELIQTYSLDELIVEDAGSTATINTYSTSAKVVMATSNLTPTIALDFNTYDYFIVERCLTIPIYSGGLTKRKGYNDYSISAVCYELTNTLSGTWNSLDNQAYAHRNTTVYSAGAVYKLLYYASASVMSIYSSSSYGVVQVCSTPSLSSTTSATPTLTIKSPYLNMRGHTTYLTSGVYNSISDIRRQYHIEVYRSLRNDLNIDAWGCTQNINHILNDVNNNNKVLT